MPVTLVHIVNDSWTAEVANTNLSYTFTGADLDAQANSVQLMATAMQNGAGALEAQIPAIFSDIPPGETPFMVSESLFGLSEEMLYDTTESYVVAVGEDLLEEIVDVGTWLLALL